MEQRGELRKNELTFQKKNCIICKIQKVLKDITTSSFKIFFFFVTHSERKKGIKKRTGAISSCSGAPNSQVREVAFRNRNPIFSNFYFMFFGQKKEVHF